MTHTTKTLLSALHEVSIIAEHATQEMLADLKTRRVESGLSESELDGIAFSMSLYRNTVGRLATGLPSMDRRVDALEWWPNENRANLHGHERAVKALQYAAELAGKIIGQAVLSANVRQAISGVQFGSEASHAVLDATLKDSPKRAPVRYTVAA